MFYSALGGSAPFYLMTINDMHVLERVNNSSGNFRTRSGERTMINTTCKVKNKAS